MTDLFAETGSGIFYRLFEGWPLQCRLVFDRFFFVQRPATSKKLAWLLSFLGLFELMTVMAVIQE